MHTTPLPCTNLKTSSSSYAHYHSPTHAITNEHANKQPKSGQERYFHRQEPSYVHSFLSPPQCPPPPAQQVALSHPCIHTSTKKEAHKQERQRPERKRNKLKLRCQSTNTQEQSSLVSLSFPSTSPLSLPPLPPLSDPSPPYPRGQFPNVSRSCRPSSIPPFLC